MQQVKRYKVKVESKEKLEELLQEVYTEACQIITEAQNEINKIANSTALNEETMDAKAKYSKAVNDFILTKEKAISKKFEIAKLMSDVLKSKGGAAEALGSMDIPGDWGDMMSRGGSPSEPDGGDKIKGYIM